MKNSNNLHKLKLSENEIAILNEAKIKQANELKVAYKEIAFQIEERGTRAAELAIANIELVFQNEEKEKRAAELLIANEELLFQNTEKEKRAAELAIANIELVFQNEEKEKRAAELVRAYEELLFQNEENEKRATELTIANNLLKKAEADVLKLNTQLEQKVIKRTSQYAFLSQVNQTIVQVKDIETLFRNSCRIALEFGKFKMAWIGSFNLEENTINHLNSSGIPSEEISLFNNVRFEANGPQDTALRTGRYFLCNNVDCIKSEKWRPYAQKHKIYSFIVLPIKKAGKIFGTLNLYASETNFFDKEDITLLTEVTADISFALDFYENTKRHKEAEETLLNNEKRFRALIENSADMKTLATFDGQLLYASPSVSKILGYTLEELLITPATDLIHADDISSVFENVQKILEKKGSSFYSQHRLRLKNGEFIWCEGTFTNMLHEPEINAIVTNFRNISDKKLIEKQQEFDRYNLNALINNTNDLMWSVDLDFNLITSNIPFDEAGKDNFGRAILKGENVLSGAYTPEMLSHFRQLYERAFAGESFTEIEHFPFPANVWIQISYYPIRKGDKIIGTACHSRDITDIKNIEQQLGKSEAFNRGVLNSINSHIAVIDFSGNIIAVNESWKNFAKENGDISLQYTSEGINYFSVCNKAAESGDAIASEVLVGLKTIMDEKEKYYYVEYPCHSPEIQRWFGMRVMKFESDVPMIVVVHMDITERKLIEENLVHSEANLKEAHALLYISNWEIDLLTNVHIWSDECYKIYGLKKEDIKPSLEGFLSMLHPDDLDFAQTIIEKTFETYNAGSLNARIKRANAEIRYVYIEWKFEFDKKNNPIRLYGILQDVTERKIAEEEREKLINETIQRNRDLEQFTFMISHNLRAPTANIIGITDFLQHEDLSAQEQKELLQRLSTSVNGLDNVIKDINSILHVKRELNEKKENISFSQLVNEIVISSGIRLDKDQVKISTDFSEVEEIFSLKVYLHSIFYNLINNSIKYCIPGKQVSIDIKSRKEHGNIILTFRDNGLGIDMNKNGDNVFGLYRRFHNHVEGKGTGLFMVKTQVEAIGGKISVKSELNKGTEFTIIFEN